MKKHFLLTMSMVFAMVVGLFAQQITVTASQTEFEAGGGTATITVISDVDWMAVFAFQPDGIGLSSTTGSAGITTFEAVVLENTTMNGRKFLILFQDILTKNTLSDLELFQKGMEQPDEYFIVSGQQLFPASGGTAQLQVQSNPPSMWLAKIWKDDGSPAFSTDGIMISPTQGSLAVMPTLVVQANPTFEKRAFFITFTDMSGRDTLAVFMVEQEGQEQQELSVTILPATGAKAEITCNQQRVTLVATANLVDVDFEWYSGMYASVPFATGSNVTVNEAEMYMVRAFNETSEATATIYVVDNRDESCMENGDVYGCTDDMALNYDPEATIDDESCIFRNFDVKAGQNYFGAEGGSTPVFIESNVPWEAQVPEGFTLSPSSSSVGGFTQATLTVAPLSTPGSLSASVAFFDFDGIYLGGLNITQDGIGSNVAVSINADATELTCNQKQITLAAVATGVPAGVVATFQWIAIPDGADLEEFFEENEENLEQFTVGTEKEITVSEAGTYVVLATVKVGPLGEFAVTGDVIVITGGCETQPIYGCMDMKAVNYDPEATLPSSTAPCIYLNVTIGSSNGSVLDCNYGIDTLALFAKTNVEGVIFEWFKNGVAIAGMAGQQLTVQAAGEYKVIATFEKNPLLQATDAIVITEIRDCGEEPVFGCMDMKAVNYDPKATEDDQSCIYAYFTAEADQYNFGAEGGTTYVTVDANVQTQWFAVIYKDGTQIGSNFVSINPSQGTAPNATMRPQITVQPNTATESAIYEIVFRTASGMGLDTIIIMQKAAVAQPIYGCMDMKAVNYDPKATDESPNTPCIYLNVTIDSSDGTVLDCNSGIETLTLFAKTNVEGVSFAWFKDGVAMAGMAGQVLTVQEAGEYKVIATFEKNPLIQATDAITITKSNCVVYGCMDMKAVNYDPQATDESPNTPCIFLNVTIDSSDGTVLDCNSGIETITLFAKTNVNGVIFEWFKDGVAIAGMAGQQLTVQAADEYKVIATFEKNPLIQATDAIVITEIRNCVDTVYGCMDPTALNYNPKATVPDVCEYKPAQFSAKADVTEFSANSGSSLVTITATVQTQWVAVVLRNGVKVSPNDGISINPPSGTAPNATMLPRIAVQPNNATTSRTFEIIFQTPSGDYLDKIVITQAGYAPQPIYGCTDSTATNFNPLATQPSSTAPCVYYGCMDQTAINYNPKATAQTPNTPCKYAVYGCMEANAINYNPLATVNSDCKFATAVVYGCTDRKAINYDSTATRDNQSCKYTTVVQGCTNPQAINYQQTATVDDGSCKFPIYGCTNPAASNYNPQATVQSANTPCKFEIYGCMDEKAENYFEKATIDNGSCYYAQIKGCMAPNAINYNAEATIEDGSCKFEQKIWGCTDKQALNYEPKATADNGSCVFETIVYGCTDRSALNFEPAANRNDNSCKYAQNSVYGCMNPAALNYNPYATIANNSCVFSTVATQTIEGCTDTLALNFDPIATKDNGRCVYQAKAVAGCMQPMALNYNEKATVDDNSCVFASPENMYVQNSSSKPEVEVFSNFVKDCGFDYSSPIDTAYIAYLQAKNDGTFVAIWIIVQNDEAIVIRTTYKEKSEDAMYYLSIICNATQGWLSSDVRAITIGAQYKEGEALSGTIVSKTDSNKDVANGSVEVAGAGGTTPYTYAIGSGAFGSSSTFANLAPGNYTVTVKDATGVTYPIPVTIACTDCDVAAEFVAEASITVYPNPTAGIVYVSTASEIKVFNSQGTLLISTYGTSVDLSGFANGVYFVQVGGAQVKVVKQ